MKRANPDKICRRIRAISVRIVLQVQSIRQDDDAFTILTHAIGKVPRRCSYHGSRPQDSTDAIWSPRSKLRKPSPMKSKDVWFTDPTQQDGRHVRPKECPATEYIDMRYRIFPPGTEHRPKHISQSKDPIRLGGRGTHTPTRSPQMRSHFFGHTTCAPSRG